MDHDWEKKMGRYSIDLRERVINAYEAENRSIRQIAEVFNVHRNTVQAWINRKRKVGHLKPEAARGGKPSQLVGQQEALGVGAMSEILTSVKARIEYLSPYWGKDKIRAKFITA